MIPIANTLFRLRRERRSLPRNIRLIFVQAPSVVCCPTITFSSLQNFFYKNESPFNAKKCVPLYRVMCFPSPWACCVW